MTPVEKASLAGIVEGEGFVGFLPQGAVREAWRWSLTAIRPWLLARRGARVDEALAWFATHPRKRRLRC